MNARGAGRGQPLVVLGVVLSGWVSARAMLWEAPGLPTSPGQPAPAGPPLAPANPEFGRADPLPVPAFAPARGFVAPARAARQPLNVEPRRAASPLPSVKLVAGQQLLFMQAFSDIPLPEGLAETILTSAPPAFPPSDRGAAEGDSRWSADGWLLLRPGGKAGLGAAASATYGASQAGAVVRYRLAPDSAHRPAAYLRATAALNGSRQKEAALGLSARPLADVPVVVAVEARITDDRFGSRVRPVALAVTELPPFDLPAGLRGEAYVRGGYAGGKGATAFVDGQLKADREVLRAGSAEVRLGAGTWGGAQEDAARLDVGPSATVSLPVTENGSARLGLDWRFRVAGDAAPASGPALTLSAGF